VTGELVEPDDEAGLAATLAGLARDPARVRRLGEAARERALARTAGPLADRLASIYDDLTQR
jgi:glycosyltransferase involved in cell wall biosynthesis